MSDFFSRITQEQDPFKKLATYLPGFSGYVERQNRRAADKLLRETIARRFEDLWTRASRLQAELVSQGQIALVDEMENAAIQLRTFADRIKTAAYGYSGFFDALKIDAAKLEQLYQFDLAFFELAKQVEQTLDTLEASLQDEAALKSAIRQLTTWAHEANQVFDHRREAMTGTS